VQQCGIPDLRSAAVTGQRQKVPNTFGAESTNETVYSSTTPDYFKAKYGDAVTQHAAFLYINVGVGIEQEKYTAAAWKADGYHYDYEAGIDISDFNYAPFVQTMKSKGIQIVQFIGAESQAANLMKAIKSQQFHPTAVVLQANTYDAVFPQAAGDAATGAYTYIPGGLFTEASGNKEVQLYEQWLARVAPNAEPSFFGEFAWSAMRLFVEQAQKAGPDLTRNALLANIRTVKDWTSNGMHAPQQVGAKQTGVCESVIQWNGSAWVRITPAPWTCGRSLSSAGA
jgi:ABC-type branched-subunit amino acid transport system substrate-binding protein